MQDFLDSTDLIGNGPALAGRLRRDGYLFLRGLLPREAVLEVRGRLLEKAAEGGWLDPVRPIKDGVANPDAACKDPEERYMAVFRGIWADEALHRLKTHPDVLALFESIFGEPALAHPMFVQRNIFPQSESFDFTTGPHQDKVHIGGATNHAMWVPLGDCPKEKGALAVAAGSHLAGVLDTKVGSGAGGMDICVPIPGQWVTGDFRAGDALIFSDTAVHRALPNRSAELRQSFDARYQPASQPVADAQSHQRSRRFSFNVATHSHHGSHPLSVGQPPRSEATRLRCCGLFSLRDFSVIGTTAEGFWARRWGMVRARRGTPHESERRARAMLWHHPFSLSDAPERSDDGAARSAAL